MFELSSDRYDELNYAIKQSCSSEYNFQNLISTCSKDGDIIPIILGNSSIFTHKA